MREICSEYEQAILQQKLKTSIIGSPTTVKEREVEFVNQTQAHEIMVNGQIFDHGARLHSFEIVADLFRK